MALILPRIRTNQPQEWNDVLKTILGDQSLPNTPVLNRVDNHSTDKALTHSLTHNSLRLVADFACELDISAFYVRRAKELSETFQLRTLVLREYTTSKFGRNGFHLKWVEFGSVPLMLANRLRLFLDSQIFANGTWLCFQIVSVIVGTT